MTVAPSLNIIKLQLNYPAELPIEKMRSWLLSQLRLHGEPLRWAITSVEHPEVGTSDLELHLEAVMIEEALEIQLDK